MVKKGYISAILILVMICTNCNTESTSDERNFSSKIDYLLSSYAEVSLNPDISSLSDNQKEMISYLIKASDIIDDLYWKQTCGNVEQIAEDQLDSKTGKYVNINYGPWDRLNGNKPFLDGVARKPEGANFYPSDITYQEFMSFTNELKYSPYSLIRRNEVGGLHVIPYIQAYYESLVEISDYLKKASTLAENKGFADYLLKKSEDILTNDFYKSDIAWMKVKDNPIDFVIGPIEDAEDQLFWTKKTYQAMLLLKDPKISKSIAKYALLLPYLQESLPIDAKYIVDVPGELSDIMIYDVLYCSGYWNAASKKIAFNLPMDGKALEEVGSRKLQFNNVLQAKFNKIMVPISNLLIDKKQLEHITYTAFAQNSMFYEIGSALGVKTTIEGIPVREALKEQYYVIEESKNDILSLFFITKLYEMGEITEGTLMDNYVTYMAHIFRSVRFGISNDQGVSNMIRFYYFEDKGAFTRDDKTGRYTVNLDKMKQAMTDLAEYILSIQGNGDYEAAKRLVDEKGYIRDILLDDLYRLQKENIPKDIVFNQGTEILGLGD